MNIAIILAAGTGARMGNKIPKQFVKVLNKPILAYTLEIFQKNKNIDVIEVVYHKDWIDEVKNIIIDYHISKVRWLVAGGLTFQKSTLNGVVNLKNKITSNDIVVISFGVSPMTTDDVIDDSIKVCKKYGNAIASEDMTMCTCIKDDSDQNRSSIRPILREKIKGFANPWSFKFGELCEAYETAEKQNILDNIEPHTTSLYFALGKRVYFSKGTNSICKITYKEDIDIFEGWLLMKMKQEGRLLILK